MSSFWLLRFAVRRGVVVGPLLRANRGVPAAALAGVELVALLVLAQCLFAASEYRGHVAFGSVPVPGATVTARQGNLKFVVVTDVGGDYRFPELTKGTWAIEVDMLGFATVRGDTSTSNWELQMLPLEEIRSELARKVSMTPMVPAAPASNAQVAARPEDVFVDIIANQPFSELSQLATGAVIISGTINKSAASRVAPGLDNPNPAPMLAQPVYYGDIGVFPGISLFNARSFSLTGQNTPKPSYNHFTAVAKFGGPLIPHKNNAAFFIGYQRMRNSDANTADGQMPTEIQRGGDFSQSRNLLGQSVRIVDPLTGLPFVGDVIPESRISPQAKSLLALFPSPNSSSAAQYNYQIPIVEATHQDAVHMRLSESFDTRNQLFGTLDVQNEHSDAPSLFNFLDLTRTVGINTAINYTTRMSQHFSATFRYQFSRLATQNTPYFANRLNVSAIAGINGNDQAAVNWGPPSLIFSGGTSSLSDSEYLFNRNETNTVSCSSFWSRDRHNITFGGDLRRQQMNVLSQQNPRGTFAFTAAASGDDLADFLLGTPDTASLAFGNADKYFRQTFYEAFIADDLKLNRATTLNLGVRWEYESPISELYGRFVNLAIAPGFSAITPVVGNNFVHPDRDGIQPRDSFAWRPIRDSSLVIRAGYGLYRNTNVYQSIADQIAQQPPLSKNLSVQNASSNPLTLANGFVTVQGITNNTFAVDPTFRVGYAQIWNLSLQHDLPAAVQMTVSYLGTKGTRLPQQSLPNTFPSGALNPAGYIYLTSNGNSIREAGQIQLRRRLGSGFTATAQYTYSKALDDAPLMDGGKIATANTGGMGILPGSEVRRLSIRGTS